MKKIEFVIIAIVSLLLGFFIIDIVNLLPKNQITKYPKREEVQEQVKYLKDSFSDDYYKKQLDSFYLFEHSKISVE